MQYNPTKQIDVLQHEIKELNKEDYGTTTKIIILEDSIIRDIFSRSNASHQTTSHE